MESDGHARSTCGVRELRQPPVRRSVRQRAAAARRPTSIVCWWQSGDAGGAADRRRAPAPTGHRAAACDQHDTRRHTATSLMMMLLLRPPAAPRGSATGSSGNDGIERSAFDTRVSLSRAESSRARGAPTPATSVSRPTHIQVVSRATRDQTDPSRSSRLGGASPISFSRYSASGRTLELGRSGRTIDHAAAAAPGARCEVRGHGKHAALKDQRLIASRLTFLIDFVRSKASWFSQHAAAPAAWRNSPPCRQGPSWARGVSRSDNAERIRYLRGRSVPRIGARHPPLALRQFRWAMA